MTVAIVAILIGLGGAYIVRQQMHRPEVPPMPVAAPQDVVVPVALNDLEVGRTLTINDIAIRSFSPEEFAESEFATMAYMRNSQQIVGRTVRTAIERGQAFMPEHLYAEGMGPDLAERLQAGFRAVTVPIENIGAVQGFARPGSFVDVLFRVDEDTEEERPEVTLTLLERIEVLAINTYTQPGQQVSMDADGSVTLAVRPHQAKILKVVEERGSLSLTLRNPEDQFEFIPFELGLDESISQIDTMHGATPVSLVDREIADRGAGEDIDRALGLASERVTLDDLLGLPPRPKKVEMEVFLGSQRSVLEFDDYDTDNFDILRQGAGIRTPIAGDPQGYGDSSRHGPRSLYTSGSAQ
jgi:Flp pilus assembly protein CpaB